jgi:predicted metal-dependent peptidase
MKDKQELFEEANERLDEMDQAAQKLEEEAAALEAIRRALVKLIIGRDAKSAFFATLVMKLHFAPSYKVETTQTDGINVFYNPKFICSLPKEQVLGVVAHDATHVAHAHPARRAWRNKKKWAKATDCAINPILRECGFELPKEAIFPGKGEYKDVPVNCSAEEAYSLIPDECEDEQADDEQADDESSDPGGCGNTADPGDGSASARQESEAKSQQMMASAQQAASQKRGDLPGSLQRAIDAALKSHIDWKAALREFVSRQARDDYSWMIPNRRFVSQGIYLPGMRSDELGDLIVFVDVSGSVTDKMLSIFAGELNAICEGFACKIKIIYHDTIIQKEEDWEASDGPLVLKICGGGGTSHVPVFDWLGKQSELPTCVVCLTDLFTEFPKLGPDCPVLWCITGNPDSKAPFGRSLHMPNTVDCW